MGSFTSPLTTSFQTSAVFGSLASQEPSATTSISCVSVHPSTRLTAESAFHSLEFRRFLDNPPEFTYHAPNTTGHFRVENSTFVIVTLYSSSGSGGDSTGFILEYNSIFSGNISSNTVSTHHISPPSTIDFRYPSEGNYTTYELAAFVFPPKDNLYKSNNVEHVAFDISGIKENCWDVIFLYTLNVTAPIGGRAWSYTERICHYSESKVFPHEDVGLALFQSSTTSVQGHSFGYSVFGC